MRNYEKRKEEFSEFFAIINLCEEINEYYKTGKKISSRAFIEFSSYVNSDLSKIKEAKVNDYLKENLVIRDYETFASLVCYKNDGYYVQKMNKDRSSLIYNYLPYVYLIQEDKRMELLKEYLLTDAEYEVFEYVIWNKALIHVKGDKHIMKSEPTFHNILKEIEFTKDELIELFQKTSGVILNLYNKSNQKVFDYVAKMVDKTGEEFLNFFEELNQLEDDKYIKDPDYEKEYGANRYFDGKFKCIDYSKY